MSIKYVKAARQQRMVGGEFVVVVEGVPFPPTRGREMIVGFYRKLPNLVSLQRSSAGLIQERGWIVSRSYGTEWSSLNIVPRCIY
ncbi:hypothetical protein E2C01_022448 [Portunus trituberculatus]|uniref:Uncharacterized protein n=1 Tax=Portunus trituberculatus TaxID=210409 RepID=A0A5B7E7Q3_PORTR|nr:hypothetical protein [Portunus trituberculatus]